MRKMEEWSFPPSYLASSINDTPLPDDELAPRRNPQAWVDVHDISPDDVLPAFKRNGIVRDASDPLDLLPRNLRTVPRRKLQR